MAAFSHVANDELVVLVFVSVEFFVEFFSCRGGLCLIAPTGARLFVVVLVIATISGRRWSSSCCDCLKAEGKSACVLLACLCLFPRSFNVCA